MDPTYIGSQTKTQVWGSKLQIALLTRNVQVFARACTRPACCTSSYCLVACGVDGAVPHHPLKGYYCMGIACHAAVEWAHRMHSLRRHLGRLLWRAPVDHALHGHCSARSSQLCFGWPGSRSSPAQLGAAARAGERESLTELPAVTTAANCGNAARASWHGTGERQAGTETRWAAGSRARQTKGQGRKAGFSGCNPPPASFCTSPASHAAACY